MRNFFQSKAFRFIWSAALAVLLFMACPPCFSKTTCAIVLGILFLLVNGSPFISRFPIITHIARFLVGGLFIFSGFIKANDPLGFSYKLEEYFQVFKGDTGWSIFESFEHIALPLAILLCVSEMILGFMLLIGYKRNLTLWLLLAQIVFFTFLTFYSACYNKVTHCGCFGDFLKLKPWESFWKDIVLMILITLLFAGRENINELFKPMIGVSLTLFALIASIAFPLYAYRNLPPFDFRAYAPGMDLKENMKPGPHHKDAVYESVLVYENLKTHELKEFSQEEYNKQKIWEDTLTWKWNATNNKVVSEEVEPAKISDFSVTNLDGMNITDSLLNNKDYSFWLIEYNLSEKTEKDPTLHAKIDDFYKLATEDHKQFVAFTNSSAQEIDNYKHEHNALYDFANVDGTVLKTMIRSDPGLMLMKDGKVIANWHWRNFPTYSDVKQKFMK